MVATEEEQMLRELRERPESFGSFDKLTRSFSWRRFFFRYAASELKLKLVPAFRLETFSFSK